MENCHQANEKYYISIDNRAIKIVARFLKEKKYIRNLSSLPIYSYSFSKP